jgi:DNA-binding transcriptional MerR regulator
MNIGEAAEAAGLSAKMVRHHVSIAQIADLLRLWSNHRRASRQVKALAHAHLVALQEKMREMAAMQLALERLLKSCRGDNHPHARSSRNWP